MAWTVTALAATAVAALGLGGAALAAEDGPYPVWWSPSLELDSLDVIEERLARKLWPDGDGIEVYEGGRKSGEIKVADTCASTIQLSDAGYWALPWHDYKVHLFQLARCRAIQMLERAAPARKSFVRDFITDREAVDYLSAMVRVPMSCDWLCRQHMANGKRIAWSQLEDILNVDFGTDYKMMVRTDTTRTEIEILARADFNADGSEDLLVLADTYATEGRWGGAEIYVLTREASDEIMRVLNADEYLCPDYTCQNYYNYPEVLR